MSASFDPAKTGPGGPGMWDPMPLVPPVSPPTPPKPEEFIWSKPEELDEPVEQVLAEARKPNRSARAPGVRSEGDRPPTGRPVKKSAKRTAGRASGRPVKKSAKKASGRRKPTR
jgi:hypothetical protein